MQIKHFYENMMKMLQEIYIYIYPKISKFNYDGGTYEELR